MDDIVLEALLFAEWKHGNQVYTQADGDKPYIYHLRGVVEIGQHMGLSTDELVVCALHDIFEDTPTGFGEVVESFGIFIAEKAMGTARREDETYPRYIERVGESEFLRAVKVCDLLFNLEHCATGDEKHQKLHTRYEKALYYLATHFENK